MESLCQLYRDILSSEYIILYNILFSTPLLIGGKRSEKSLALRYPRFSRFDGKLATAGNVSPFLITSKITGPQYGIRVRGNIWMHHSFYQLGTEITGKWSPTPPLPQPKQVGYYGFMRYHSVAEDNRNRTRPSA